MISSKKGSQSTFGNRLASLLTKLNDAATITVAHEGIKVLLSEFQLKQILGPILGQLENQEHLSERQRREQAKVYILLIDTYREDILTQNLYQRFIDSLSKKSVGVGEVVGHLCKSILSRIEPKENVKDYVKHLIIQFKNNQELCKVLKQIIENVDQAVINQFQSDIISLIQEKMLNSKTKSELFDVIIKLIIAIEERFSCQNNVGVLLIKYLQSDEWTTRKACVDLCHTLLVVKKQTNPTLHEILKELKYDKIKHVRDSVTNYEQLYKQLLEPQILKLESKIVNVPKSPRFKGQLQISKSPAPKIAVRDHSTSSMHSLSKVKSQINTKFFENADNKDVLKVSEKCVAPNENFETYLQNRPEKVKSQCNIPRPQAIKLVPPRRHQHDLDHSESHIMTGHSINESLYKQSREAIAQSQEALDRSLKIREGEKQVLKQTSKELSLEVYITELKNVINSFEKQVLDRITKIEIRLTSLEQKVERNELQTDQSSILDNSRYVIGFSERESFLSGKPNEFRQREEKGDEDYRAALSTNNRQALLRLFQQEVLPSNSVTQDCLLVQIRKMLGEISVLKWLKIYLIEKKVNKRKLQKLFSDLSQRNEPGNPDYELLKNMVLNEISGQLKMHK